MVRAEEKKFVEVTEPVADLTVRVLSWSGRAGEAEALCTSVVDFLRWEQTEGGDGRMWQSFLWVFFKRGRSALFTRRKVLEITNKFRLERCKVASVSGDFVGAESDARSVLNIGNIFHCRALVAQRKQQQNRALQPA